MSSQNSDNQSKMMSVKKALEQISGFYPELQATDRHAFLTAAAMLLMEYPSWLIRQFAHPVHGIAPTARFFPNLAEMKSWLDGVLLERKQQNEEVARWHDLKERYQPNNKPQLSPPKPTLRLANLCDYYSIADILPAGWNAADLMRIRMRCNDRDQVRAEIENWIIAGNGRPSLASASPIAQAAMAFTASCS